MSRRAPGPSLRDLSRIAARGARDPLAAIEAVAAHGDVSRVKLGPLDAWLLNRPDLARYVFEDAIDGFDKGSGVTTRFLGEGLIALDDRRHARRRAAVMPALEPSAMGDHTELVRSLASELAGGWPEGGEIDAQKEMGALNTRVAVGAFFGLDPRGEAGRRLGAALDRAAAAAAKLVLPNLSATEKLPLPGNRPFARARAELDEIVFGLIAAARAGEAERPSALRALADAGELDDAELRDEVMTMFGGHRSAAAGLGWALHLLAAHPEADATLAAEVGGRGDGPPGPVATGVAAEALRLYPPIWVLPRRATRAHGLDGHEVREGATVLVSAWLLHRDGRWWERPDRFDPGRWAPGASGGPPHPAWAYFPFSGGPRRCAGEEVEWMEMPVALEAIRSRRRLVPAGGEPRTDAKVMLRAKGGLPLRTERARAR